MQVQFEKTLPEASAQLILFQAEDQDLLAPLFNEKGAAQYKKMVDLQSYEPKFGHMMHLTFPSFLNENIASLFIIGVGKLSEMTEKKWISLGGKLTGSLQKAAIKEVVCNLPFTHEAGISAALAFGMGMRNYSFNHYKSEPAKSKMQGLSSVIFCNAEPEKEAAIYEGYKAVQEGVYCARDLLTEPSNILTPSVFATRCKALESLGLEVEVLDEAALKEMGMGALLGVGQGSSEPSKVVVMKYQGDKNSQEFPLALVGKGVTFDSGGISLKPRVGMELMKMDMGGAGTIAGLMKTLALRGAKSNIVAVLGLVENMCSGTAQRPGDVVRSMSGKTIEIRNTDAEGRLVLADILWYAQERFKPQTVLDLATLTGSMLIAFGNEYAGLFSNRDDLVKELSKSALKTHDKIWHMPLDDAYKAFLKSDIADLNHTLHKSDAKSSAAAQFLAEFIQTNVRWAHLDIAGTAWSENAGDLHPKGATGWGVALLDRYIQDYFEHA